MAEAPAQPSADGQVVTSTTSDRKVRNMNAATAKLDTRSYDRIATLESLREHLQWAIELEHFTVPPYLCALLLARCRPQSGRLRGRGECPRRRDAAHDARCESSQCRRWPPTTRHAADANALPATSSSRRSIVRSSDASL